MPTPFDAACIGVNWFRNVMMDSFKDGVVDSIGGSLDINDGFLLWSVFVLKEEQQEKDGDDDVGNGFHS